MRRLIAATAAIVPMIMLFGSTFHAQRRPPVSDIGSIRWYASIADADQMPEARSFRIYGTPDQLTLALVTVNETARPMALNQAMFSSHVRFSVLRTSAVPVVVTWLPEAWRGALGPTPVLPDETFEVGTRRGIEWRVVVRPTDGDRFVAGQYIVNIQLSGEMAARSTVRRMQLAVLASPAWNEDERAAENHFLGRTALAKGRLVEA